MHREQDSHDGRPILVGGGDWLYIAPAVAVAFRTVTLQAELKAALYRSLENRQLDAGYVFQFGAIWTPF